MSTTTSVGEVLSHSPARPFFRLATALEVLLVYAGILQYIWRWQFTYPRTWMALLGTILLSHLIHRDSAHELGFTGERLRANAATTLPLVLAFYLPALLYGFASHAFVPTVPGKPALLWFLGYGSWCVFQQYLAQSYFNHRLMSVVRNRHVSSLVVGLMFGAAHIPNPILMIVTTAGGLVFAEIFARHRNIWPLALAQTVAGGLTAALSPSSLIHNMRVGPGYFFYGLR